jgi:hypothetical protein
MTTTTFSPIDYGFRWTSDDWYEYDGKEAERTALRERNAFAKRLKAEGRRVRKGSLGKQLVSMGGIGSGKPHIELVVPVYYVSHD